MMMVMIGSVNMKGAQASLGVLHYRQRVLYANMNTASAHTVLTNKLARIRFLGANTSLTFHSLLMFARAPRRGRIEPFKLSALEQYSPMQIVVGLRASFPTFSSRFAEGKSAVL
jgi:hypothetical protein